MKKYYKVKCCVCKKSIGVVNGKLPLFGSWDAFLRGVMTTTPTNKRHYKIKGLINYSQIGEIVLLYILGLAIYKRIGSMYSVVGIKFNQGE